MNADNLQRELDVAIGLAQQAGTVIMELYGTSVTVDHKPGDEPVTVADRHADTLIAKGLREAFPRDGLLSEESDDDLSRLNKERVWIVDPLDGTSEFISGSGDFVVQIGLALRGQPVLGVIFQPTTNRLLYAVQGRGAHQVLGNRTTRLRVSTTGSLPSLCMVASRSHYSPFIESARKALSINQVHRAGSVGLKAGLVAAGKCDLYLATTISKEWDICAPHALLNEAGGKLTNLCGETPSYNKRDVVACRGLVGSNNLVHEQVVEALRPLLGSTLDGKAQQSS